MTKVQLKELKTLLKETEDYLQQAPDSILANNDRKILVKAIKTKKGNKELIDLLKEIWSDIERSSFKFNAKSIKRVNIIKKFLKENN